MAQRLQRERELLEAQGNKAKKSKNTGVNDHYYERYIKEDSRFAGANTADEYQKAINAQAMREANILGSHPEYRNTPYDIRLEIATNVIKKQADKDILNKKLYINYGGKDINEVGGYTTNTPKELQDQENFNVYADDLLDNFYAGNDVIPYKGQDGLIYTNADEIKKVKQVEEMELSLRDKLTLQDILSSPDYNVSKKTSYSNVDPTLKTDFSKQGYTGYKNKVYNRLKKGVYIKRDVKRQTYFG